MDVIINVKGMNCGHCEKAVKDAVGEFDGIEHIEIHLDSGKVKISYNQEKVSLEQICEAIEDQGYDVDR